ncbi:MAG: EpsG family protein [Bacteroidaceae bacterium]|nr:EpsG family protein [Bacteroidaceae bacterium]
MSVFYLIFILLTAYFSYRYDRIEEYDSHKQHRLWLMCGYLVCLTGFSYGLGGDKFVYMEEFETYPESVEEAKDFIWIQFMLRGQMPLWTLVNAFAKVAFRSFYVVQLIQSAVINISVCYLVSKYTHRYFLFLLVYFFTLQYFVFNTEIMREGFALAFVLVGMHGWMTGKKWLYFVTLPIGLLFHVSAAVVLLFPFAFFRVSWKTLVIAFCIAFGIWLLSDRILGGVMLSVLGGMGELVKKVLVYSLQASTIFGFLRSAITYLIFPFIIMYTVMQNETDSVRRKCMEHVLAFMVMLGIVASAFAGFTRVFNYVRVFYLAMMTEFIYTMFRYKKHLIVRLFTLMGTVFLIILQYMVTYKSTRTHYYDYFYPYTCILDETKDVYIREVAHQEAVMAEEKDNNVRNIE